MLCQRCKKNPATCEHVTQIGNEVFEFHLCPACYTELYGGLESSIGGDILANLFSEGPRRVKVCPVCGTSYSDYERTGLLGCASCYDFFKEELIPSIRRIQGKVNHVGKSSVNNDELGLHRRLKDLQEQLELALREKRYNDAGKLNKQIIEITKKIYGGYGND